MSEHSCQWCGNPLKSETATYCNYWCETSKFNEEAMEKEIESLEAKLEVAENALEKIKDGCAPPWSDAKVMRAALDAIDALVVIRGDKRTEPSPKSVAFDGETYDPKKDGNRLSSQLDRVWNSMINGEWKTLAQLRKECGGTEASISARVRDFRKEKFGSHTVESRRVAGGLWEYRLILNEGSDK